MPKPDQCPYGLEPCPKIIDMKDRIERLEKNQARLTTLIYYIAGIVSVTLGIQVFI